MPLFLLFILYGAEDGTSSSPTLGECSTTEPHPQPITYAL